VLKIDIPATASSPTWSTLETFIREQVQTCLQRVLDDEADALLGRGRHERRAADTVVGDRNGHRQPRQVALMNGTISIRRPRVRGLDARFESRILPLFQRRTPEIATLLPELSLHGLSSGDFTLALRGLLGDGAPLSASSVQRLTEDWQRDYAQWRTQDLSALEPVYVWADGIYVKAGLESTKAALLVLISELADGTKVVLAVESGHRESSESWAEILRDLTARGLPAPACVVGDGALGLWNAVGQVWPHAAEQRCWNHKLRNVVDAVPLKHQPDVQGAVQRIAAAESVADAEHERQRFHRDYRLRFPKAANAWIATGRGCSRTISFRKRIGAICAPPTSSNRPLRRCGSAPARRSVSRESTVPRPSFGGCCAWRRNAFANSTRPSSAAMCIGASVTPMASKSPLCHPPRRPPPDVHLHTS
jgi:putative transposase